MTVPEYLLIRAALVGAAFAVGTLITQRTVGGVLIAGIAFLVPKYYLSWRRVKRQKAFEDQLDDVLTLLVGALRAGYSLLHALNLVVDEIPPPASEEFRRVIREVGLGLSLPQALDNLVRRVDSRDLDMMVTAINIQQEVGGNLATILETISETIRERVRIQGEIRILTTQQKVTGYILALLPVFLGVVLFLINPEYMSRLFKPGISMAILAIAVVGEVVGFLIIQRIVNIEV
jgi:tight adherence protein B